MVLLGRGRLLVRQLLDRNRLLVPEPCALLREAARWPLRIRFLLVL